MKDTISALSAGLGFIVLLVCIWKGVDIETSLFRSFVSFMTSYALGFGSWFVFQIHLRNVDVSQNAHKDALE